ncbi:MAG TPA: SpoIIE family protein phosphatase [Symbiobacteriaceae bacterium]
MAVRDASAVPGLRRSRWTRFREKMEQRFGWLWQPRLYAGILLGFLLGRALPESQVAPFGIAFYAAVRGAGVQPLRAVPVGLAVAAGAFTVLPPLQALAVTAAVAVSHFLFMLVAPRSGGLPTVATAVLAAISGAIPAAMAVANIGWLALLFWTGLTSILAMVFSVGVSDARAGRLLHGGTVESPIPAVVVLAAALCGLDGLQLSPFGWLSLRDTAGALIVIASAHAGGAALGATAGAIIGISYLFSAFGGPGATQAVLPALDALPESRSMAFVVGGVLAGAFRELGRYGLSAAFLLGLVTYAAVMFPAASELLSLGYSAGLGAVLYGAVPRRWLAAIPASLSTPAGVRTRRRDLGPASEALLERVSSLARALRGVHRSIEQVAATAPPMQGARKAFEQVSERVCRGCSAYRECWEREFHRTYQIYTDLWKQLEEEGPLPVHPVPDVLDSYCMRPEAVIATLNYLHDLDRTQRRWERRLEEGRAMVGGYLKNVTNMLDRFVAEAGGAEDASRRPAVYKVVSGMARLPRRGGTISGDSCLGAPLGSDRYLLALSDGMGVGQEAANQSRQCVNLLHELMQAGFSTEIAVNTVNSVLLLRSPDETFATVDLAVIDLTTGRAEFVKVGAAPSFIKRGSEVTVVKMSSVPVGIINQVDVEAEYRMLRPGDLVVMLSDGVWDAIQEDVDKERWLLEQLQRETSTDPEEIAESLLARARELLPEATDDMTVLVARVDLITSAADRPERRTASSTDWVPVRRAPKYQPPGQRKQKAGSK